MPRPKESFTLSESVNSLRKLIDIGMACKQLNFCIGEIGAADIAFRDGSLQRVKRKTFYVKIRHKYALFRHRRLGHDAGCRMYGIPISVVHRLAEHWSGREAAIFMTNTYSLVCAVAVVEAESDEQRIACFEHEFSDAKF